MVSPDDLFLQIRELRFSFSQGPIPWEVIPPGWKVRYSSYLSAEGYIMPWGAGIRTIIRLYGW